MRVREGIAIARAYAYQAYMKARLAYSKSKITASDEYAWAEAIGTLASALEAVACMPGYELDRFDDRANAAKARAEHADALTAARETEARVLSKWARERAEEEDEMKQLEQEAEANMHGVTRPKRPQDAAKLLHCLGLEKWDAASVKQRLLSEDNDGHIPLERAGCEVSTVRLLLQVGHAEEQVSKLRTDRACHMALRAIAIINDIEIENHDNISEARYSEVRSYYELSSEHRSIVDKLLWRGTPLSMDFDDTHDMYYDSCVFRLLMPLFMDTFQNNMLYDKVNEAVILGVINRGQAC